MRTRSAYRARRARHRLLAAGALALALGVTACGSDSDSGSGSDSSSGKGGATRTVDTAMGKVEVPAEPERVVVLDTAELDSALTLGVTPVGATRADVESGFLSYLPDEKVKGIEDVGTIAQPNLEAIAGLDPDLILTSKVRDAERYDELKQIAPTVMTETTGYPWKENFTLHAKALGKTEKAAEVEAAYEDKVAEVTEALGGPDKAAAISTSVVRFVEGADTRIYADKNYIATILEDVGLGRPDIIEESEDGFMVEVSPEQVDKADADVLFYTSYGDPAKSGEEKALDSPLWKNMKAVESGNAFRIDDELWIQGIGYTAAGKILDELRGHLAG